jgi:hypothetical protein
MSEHDELGGARTDDGNAEEGDVEAHGLKEVAITGLSAAAMIVGAGDAMAATSPDHAAAAAKQAVHKIDAAYKGDAANKGNAANKGPTNKANAISKQSVSKDAVSKLAVDPSSRRGRAAS